jgi:hypothetical protein
VTGDFLQTIELLARHVPAQFSIAPTVASRLGDPVEDVAVEMRRSLATANAL